MCTFGLAKIAARMNMEQLPTRLLNWTHYWTIKLFNIGKLTDSNRICSKHTLQHLRNWPVVMPAASNTSNQRSFANVYCSITELIVIMWNCQRCISQGSH
ncbi:hypothetical protein AHF37_10815 [Paragonimus kellicotti]|nr:hypothetical protein AHF37_10815 [Paragonimus kellicotti]